MLDQRGVNMMWWWLLPSGGDRGWFSWWFVVELKNMSTVMLIWRWKGTREGEEKWLSLLDVLCMSGGSHDGFGRRL